VRKDAFCLELVDERGEFARGWSGFVECEEAVRGFRKGWATGNNESGKGVMEKYFPCWLPCTSMWGEH